MSRIAMIGDKQVILAEPVNAALGRGIVGREREMRVLTAAWLGGGRQPLSPLLVGEPGVGKNHVVFAIARQTRKQLFIFQGHEDVNVEDLACTVRFSDEPGRKMDYMASPLATAMIKGEIVFFDEIAKCRPRALAALVSLCDDRRSIDSSLLGERIQAHPGFRFVAATNSADLETSALPDFLQSRMRPVIPVGYPAPEEIARIITHRLESRLAARIDPLLDRFWLRWRERRPATPPTPRDVIHIFDLAINLADWGRAAAAGPPIDLEAVGDAPVVDLAHLDDAVDEFFRADTEARR